MEFIKKHYEKVGLSVVLAGLAVAVALLPVQIQSERQKLEDLRLSIITNADPYRPINLGPFDQSLRRMSNEVHLALHGSHNLFSPVLWQIKADGTWIKIVTGKEVGPDALVITNIAPLYYTISLERISGNSYYFGMVNETAGRLADRQKKVRYASTNSPKTEFCVLKEVKGPAEAPTELILELPGDAKELVSVSKDKPYRRVESYTVDLRYDPENRGFSSKRTNDMISFGGEDYIIMDIAANGIVLFSPSSTKQIQVRYNAP
jgi:hypothetical protein